MKYYDEALIILRKAYEYSGSDNHKHLFELFTNKSMSYLNVENRAMALECVTYAFEIAKKIFSENSFDMGGAYENLGMMRYILGIEGKLALENFERSIKSYPPGHPQIVTAQEIMVELRSRTIDPANDDNESANYFNIAKESKALGDFPRALGLFQKSITLLESKRGRVQGWIAVILNEIASVHRRLGNLDEELACYLESLEISEKTDEASASKPLFIARVKSNIGPIYKDKRLYDEALQWHNEALSALKIIHGDVHMDCANEYIGIALCHDGKSEHETALKQLHIAKDICISLYGENSSHLKNVYFCISNIYKNVGNTEKAKKYALLSSD